MEDVRKKMHVIAAGQPCVNMLTASVELCQPHRPRQCSDRPRRKQPRSPSLSRSTRATPLQFQSQTRPSRRRHRAHAAHPQTAAEPRRPGRRAAVRIHESRDHLREIRWHLAALPLGHRRAMAWGLDAGPQRRQQLRMKGLARPKPLQERPDVAFGVGVQPGTRSSSRPPSSFSALHESEGGEQAQVDSQRPRVTSIARASSSGS